MSELSFIHRFVAASGSSRKVLLLLHGTGGSEDDLLPLGRKLDPTAALLSPRGKVSEQGRARFFRRFGEGVFDEEDVIRRANELADFISIASASYEFDVGNITAVGYSNGANIAAAILLLRPEVIAEAILLRAMVPLSAPPVIDLPGRHVLISAGEFDQIIPASEGKRLADLLEAREAAVTLASQPAGHELTRGDVKVARSWLAERMS